MNRIPASAPPIPPLPPDTYRPLWSVMIPVYNCAQFIPDALQSVLAQDMGEAVMQIEVVDDASTDVDVEAMVRCIGKGRISYYKQAENVGSLRNFETCINRAKGQLVHLLHGDDRVLGGFYQKISCLFAQYPEVGAAFSSYNFINEAGVKTHTCPAESDKDGILKGWLLRVAERQRIQYVAMVVKREVYERLGSFYGVTYGEDWEMWVRIARYYPVAYSPDVLAEYREHLNSISAQRVAIGKTFSDLLYVADIIREYLPRKDRRKISGKARLNIAYGLLGMTYRTWEQTQNISSVRACIQQTLTASKHPLVLAHIINIYFKISRDLLKKWVRMLKFKTEQHSDHV